MITLSNLFIYPVKALGGKALASAEVRPRGLAGDRRWMVVDAAGRFLSQRTHPRLALIGAEGMEGGIVLRIPGVPALEVGVPQRAAGRCSVEVWRDTVEALPAEGAAHAVLSGFLEQPCRLVYMPDESIRPVDPRYGAAGDHVSFADAYPILLTNEASLAELNRRMAAPLPMNRFRPNLVVRGEEPFEEDTWREIQVGAVKLRVVKPCARCTVPTTDQETAARGKEPLRTLATFRKKGSQVYFGMNVIASGAGILHLGDPVKVLRAGGGLFVQQGNTL